MTFAEHRLIDLYPFKSQTPVLVDVGAHQGSVSVLFAKKNWKVVAFEPEAKNRGIFLKTLSDFSDIICIPNAVSDVTGEKVPFFVSDQHYGIHTLKPFHKTHQFAYEVETIRLDDALRDLSVSEVTFLKIDIEGADFLALKGFDWEHYAPEVVIVEFMDSRSIPNFGYSYNDIVHYMHDRGYATFVSEWDEIKEYGRPDKQTEPHTWLQCSPYPLNHQPAWGNLIFVLKGHEAEFQQTLDSYLRDLKRSETLQRVKQVAKKIPGVQSLYKLLMGR